MLTTARILIRRKLCLMYWYQLLNLVNIGCVKIQC